MSSDISVFLVLLGVYYVCNILCTVQTSEMKLKIGDRLSFMSKSYTV